MRTVLLFSLTAMANPSLVAATSVMLVLPNPRRLMLGYLLGALLMSLTVGWAIVFALHDSGAVNTAECTVNPVADLGLGAVLLVLAVVLRGGRQLRLRHRHREAGPAKAPPRWRRALDGGSPRTTFVVGALLTLPGASYLAALHGIIELDGTTLDSVLLVVMVNLIMLALVEVPLVAFAVAPEWTPRAIDRVVAWFARNSRQIVVTGLAAVGFLLLVRGVITLASA